MARARRQKSVPIKRKRGKRLEARMTAERKVLTGLVAASEGCSIADFVLDSVQNAAKRSIAERQAIELSATDSQAFVEALLNPREPSKQMQERVAAYRALIGDQ